MFQGDDYEIIIQDAALYQGSSDAGRILVENTVASQSLSIKEITNG